jgi:hypothetical protein
MRGFLELIIVRIFEESIDGLIKRRARVLGGSGEGHRQKNDEQQHPRGFDTSPLNLQHLGQHPPQATPFACFW